MALTLLRARGESCSLKAKPSMAALHIHNLHLERNTQARLAQNVAYTLQDWSKGYQEVSLSEVMLIDASGKEAIRSVQRALEARHVPYRLLTGSIFAVSLQVLSRSGVYKLLEGVGVVVREAVVQ